MSVDSGGSINLSPIYTSPDTTDYGQIHIIVVISLIAFILFRAFLTLAETSITALNDAKVKKMADDGHKGAIRVVKLISSPNRFLATTELSVTLCSLFTAAVAAKSYTNLLTSIIQFPNMPYIIKQIIALLIIILAISFIYIVFGNLVPKRIAIQSSEKLAFSLSVPLLFIYNIFKPIIFIMSAITGIIVKLFGFDPNGKEEKVTEEEIMMMVDAGEEKGFIEESAKDMIAGIFDFDDITVAEVMTHRQDITSVSDSSQLNEAVELAVDTGYSRIPVFHDDIDNIIGIIYVKDLLKYVCTNIPKEIKVSDLMREPYFVPRSKKCSELFSEMTASKTQIAIVIDEYGGTEGLLTMEDLVECIVGNIQDEYDNEDEYIKRLEDNKFLVDGSVSIDDIEETIGITINNEECETIAGWIMEKLGHIPENNERPCLTVENTKFTVDKMDNRRISKILIEKQVQKIEEITEEEKG